MGSHGPWVTGHQVPVLWKLEAQTLDPPWKICVKVWRLEKKEQRVANRSDFKQCKQSKVHLKVQAGSSIKIECAEKLGCWLFEDHRFFVLFLPLASRIVQISCSSLRWAYSWPGYAQWVPVDGKT